MENLINKINPADLISKNMKTLYSGNSTVIFVDFIHSIKSTNKKLPLTVILLDIEHSSKPQTKQMLKFIKEDKKQFLLNLVNGNYDKKFNDLRYMVLEIHNPLMQNDYYFITKSSNKPLFIDDKKYNNQEVIDLMSLSFNDIQVSFMKEFVKLLGKEYANQIKEYYCKFIEKNIKTRKEKLKKEQETLEYFSKELEDVKNKKINENEYFINSNGDGLNF